MGTATKAAKHSAAGQYLGYSLQTVRLAARLLDCQPGSSVSLELLDDVAVHRADGLILLEQDKSGLTHNPLADWSLDLWKTIAIWTEKATNDTGDLIRRYELYVTPQWSGVFATRFHQVRTDVDVDGLISEIKDQLENLKKKPRCLPFAKVFLDAPQDIQRRLASRIRVISNADDPVEAVRHPFRIVVSPTVLDDVASAVIGMAKEAADALIRQKKPAIIEGDKFKTRVGSMVRRSVHPGLLAALSSNPTDAEIGAVLTGRPTFIRQLELIDIDLAGKVRAVGDYLRSSADRSLWAEKGEIFEGSLADWDNDLLRRHSMIVGETKDLHGAKDAKAQGRLTYHRCSQVEAPLEGRVVPGHFVHGSFNTLADARKLGWHPTFSDLLDMEVIS